MPEEQAKRLKVLQMCIESFRAAGFELGRSILGHHPQGWMLNAVTDGDMNVALEGQKLDQVFRERVEWPTKVSVDSVRQAFMDAYDRLFMRIWEVSGGPEWLARVSEKM
jgi:hypothetical protein